MRHTSFSVLLQWLCFQMTSPEWLAATVSWRFCPLRLIYICVPAQPYDVANTSSSSHFEHLYLFARLGQLSAMILSKGCGWKKWKKCYTEMCNKAEMCLLYHLCCWFIRISQPGPCFPTHRGAVIRAVLSENSTVLTTERLQPNQDATVNQLSSKCVSSLARGAIRSSVTASGGAEHQTGSGWSLRVFYLLSDAIPVDERPSLILLTSLEQWAPGTSQKEIARLSIYVGWFLWWRQKNHNYNRSLTVFSQFC